MTEFPAEIKITIEELNNGWVVTFFSRKGPMQLDNVTYIPNLPEVYKAIEEFYYEVYD
jgi:hypothetical protein